MLWGMGEMDTRHQAHLSLSCAALASAIFLSGCVTQGSIVDQPPVVAAVSRPNDDLRRIPPPVERVTVAVYGYDDLTGQYKERDNVQTLSKAVTQGGASILIKALQDAGERRWFTVLDRSELDSLLKERQIVTEMRRLYRNESRIDAKVLPPLMHAGLIIEGGIIGYDTNVQTGGAGARFLGIGADTKYLRDVVTVTLRAISTKTGEVLTTVTTRKAVASYALQGGSFLYVKLDELLEAEAGVTYNEPKQIAVQSAIEKAVESLIIEGVEIGLWKFADPGIGAEYIEAYRHQKYGEKISPAAELPPAPETEQPTELPETVALAPRPTVLPRRTTVRTTPITSSSADDRAFPATSGGKVREVLPNLTTPQGVPADELPRVPPPPSEEEEALG